MSDVTSGFFTSALTISGSVNHGSYVRARLRKLVGESGMFAFFSSVEVLNVHLTLIAHPADHGHILCGIVPSVIDSANLVACAQTHAGRGILAYDSTATTTLSVDWVPSELNFDPEVKRLNIANPCADLAVICRGSSADVVGTEAASFIIKVAFRASGAGIAPPATDLPGRATPAPAPVDPAAPSSAGSRRQ